MVQTGSPPLGTTTEPLGEPVVPEVTVAEMVTDPSSPYEVEAGDTVSEVELVAG